MSFIKNSIFGTFRDPCKLVNFHTWAAMLYSSISGSLVKWNWSGSSVEMEMLRPLVRW